MRLREIRKRKGLTQAELSRRSHINRVCISQYETGVKRPNVDNLKRLAVALGVSTDELLGVSA